MALSAPNVAASSGANIRTFDVTSSAGTPGDDGLTSLTVTHGLGFTPTLYIATPTIGTLAVGTCYSITNVTATTFDFVKSTNVGSAGAGANNVIARVYVGRWMSAIQ